ncbi:MAG: helix-turn-helix transcriptional regulator [Euryarchaeota archaeon]|nr:helix-turn-helix transcriptional regulator [Euryarchaeota archaeon]
MPKARVKKETPCATVPGGCEITELFRLLGKAHMLDLLHLFIREEPRPKRFVDLQARLGLSPNTLSGRLKELVAAGLLSRTVYNEIPPRVDYEATDKARTLCPVFEALHGWAAENTLRNDVVVESVGEVVA